MVRERVIQTVKYGQFREAREKVDELSRICETKGLRPLTCWVPLAGVTNELIIETEYPSLADFERENAAFYSDPDTMRALRGIAEHVIEGSGRAELIESAPFLA